MPGKPTSEDDHVTVTRSTETQSERMRTCENIQTIKVQKVPFPATWAAAPLCGKDKITPQGSNALMHDLSSWLDIGQPAKATQQDTVIPAAPFLC